MQHHYSTTRFRRVIALRRTDGDRNVHLSTRISPHPSWLSNITAGSRPVRDDDPRILRLLTLTGLQFNEALQAAGPPILLEEQVAPKSAA